MNRTRDLPACSAVPQPTAPPRTPMKCISRNLLYRSPEQSAKVWQPSPTQIITDQTQLENVEYLNSLASSIINNARCSREIKSRIVMAKSVFNKKNNLFTSKLDLDLRKKLLECYLRKPALYGPETWTLLKADQKYLETFTMWCCRRIKISGTSRVKNEEVLHRVTKERNIIHTTNRRKANCIMGCAQKGVSCRAAAPTPRPKI